MVRPRHRTRYPTGIDLAARARVEGVLREGTVPKANQTIHLSRTRFGSKTEERAYRTVHDTTTKTDAAGHYDFPASGAR
jgi:hypothetical protein